jgi:fumarate reductase subunit C
MFWLYVCIVFLCWWSATILFIKRIITKSGLWWVMFLAMIPGVNFVILALNVVTLYDMLLVIKKKHMFRGRRVRNG